MLQVEWHFLLKDSITSLHINAIASFGFTQSKVIQTEDNLLLQMVSSMSFVTQEERYVPLLCLKSLMRESWQNYLDAFNIHFKGGWDLDLHPAWTINAPLTCYHVHRLWLFPYPILLSERIPLQLLHVNIPILPSGILDCCKQKLWPSICSQQTIWYMLEEQFLRSEEQEKETAKTKKAPLWEGPNSCLQTRLG